MLTLLGGQLQVLSSPARLRFYFRLLSKVVKHTLWKCQLKLRTRHKNGLLLLTGPVNGMNRKNILKILF